MTPNKKNLQPLVITNNEDIKYAIPQSAVVLDRDGVIIEEQPNYLRSEDAINYIPGSIQAIKDINDHNIPIIVVTNQSAVGRKIISLDQATLLNKIIMKDIENRGAKITAIYMCYHHPEDNCPCRKPSPMMPFLAKKEMNLDLEESYFIGDTLKDMETATAAQLKSILVLTGHGRGEYKTLDATKRSEYTIATDLLDATHKLFA